MSTYPRITEIPTGDAAWSHNDEDWQSDSLADLIEAREAHGDPLAVGDVVYVADKESPGYSMFVPDADDLIENMGERAYDEGGEFAEDWPDVSADGKAELDALLEAWAEKHLPAPTWWNCVNIREYVITQADIDSAASAEEWRT